MRVLFLIFVFVSASSARAQASPLISEMEISALISGTGMTVGRVTTFNPDSLLLLRSTISVVQNMDHGAGGLGPVDFQFQEPKLELGTKENPIVWRVSFVGKTAGPLFNKDQGCSDAEISIKGYASVNTDASVEKVVTIEEVSTKIDEWGNCL